VTFPEVVQGLLLADNDYFARLAFLFIGLDPREKELDQLCLIEEGTSVVEVPRAHKRHDNGREAPADEVLERANSAEFADLLAQVVLAFLLH